MSLSDIETAHNRLVEGLEEIAQRTARRTRSRRTRRGVETQSPPMMVDGQSDQSSAGQSPAGFQSDRMYKFVTVSGTCTVSLRLETMLGRLVHTITLQSGTDEISAVYATGIAVESFAVTLDSRHEHTDFPGIVYNYTRHPCSIVLDIIAEERVRSEIRLSTV